MPRENAIHVRDVSKKFRLYHERPQSLKLAVVRRQRARFDELWALKNISLDINRGETFGLIGHNGSGKSTLLRLIAGIYPPTEGEISANGRIAALLELGAGFHPELSGRENIFLNGSIMGLNRKQIRAAMDQIIEFSGLEKFIDNPVKVYSSGMYIRLGFSIAINLQPDILLIDEILAVGDEEFQRRCTDHIFELKNNGVTIVFVSHSLPTVRSMCDRVAWLDSGTLHAEGRPSQVIDSYVQWVNEREEQRLGREPEQQVTGSRHGSREATIVDVQYYDRDDRRIHTARTGETLVVRIYFQTDVPLDEPVFGLGVHHESGAHIAGPNTSFSQVSTGSIRGEGHVDYVLERLVLLPGTYLLSASLYDKNILHPYDFHDQMYELKVQPGRSAERYGLVELPGRWVGPFLRQGHEAVKADHD